MMRPFVHVSCQALVYTLSSASPCFDERALAADTSRAPGSSLPTHGPDSSRGRYRYRAMDVRPARERRLLRPVRCGCGREGGRMRSRCGGSWSLAHMLFTKCGADVRPLGFFHHRRISVLGTQISTQISGALSFTRVVETSLTHRTSSTSDAGSTLPSSPRAAPVLRAHPPVLEAHLPAFIPIQPRHCPIPHPPAPDHFRSSPQPIPFPCAKLRRRPRSRPHLALPRSRACASVHCAVDRLRAG
jgi:hypothetical protein